MWPNKHTWYIGQENIIKDKLFPYDIIDSASNYLLRGNLIVPKGKYKL